MNGRLNRLASQLSRVRRSLSTLRNAKGIPSVERNRQIRELELLMTTIAANALGREGLPALASAEGN